MAEKMTLGRMREWHLDEVHRLRRLQHPFPNNSTVLSALMEMHQGMADLIEAQPAQAVDVLEGDELAEFAEAVKDDRQRLPKGWRIEVREAMGLQPGLCVLGPVGAFAVDRDTMHKSTIRGEVIEAFGMAMHNSAREDGSHD